MRGCVRCERGQKINDYFTKEKLCTDQVYVQKSVYNKSLEKSPSFPDVDLPFEVFCRLYDDDMNRFV